MKEVNEAQARKQLAYDEAVKGKTDEEIVALNYFFNAAKKKGCFKKKKVLLVSDAQYDELVAKRASELTEQAVLAALGLDGNQSWFIESLKVHTPEFEDAEYVKMGDDEMARTSRITTTVLLYGADTMYFYARTFSLTDRYNNELAASIMYKDITSIALNTVTTESRRDVIEQSGCLKKNKEIQVWVPATANKVIFTVPGKTYTVNIGNAKSIMTATIAKLRNKIAECKKK